MAIEIDEEMLKRLEILDPNREAGLMKSLVELYINSISPSMVKLRAAVDAGDKAKLSKVAHGLKSGHANLGANPIVAIFQRIEDLKFSDEELPSLVVEIEKLSHEAGTALQAYLQKGS